MKHSDFRIGTRVRLWEGAPEHWLCTDVGSRTVVAIKIDPKRRADWYTGPPYAVNETVLDEHDIEGCHPIFFIDIVV